MTNLPVTISIIAILLSSISLILSGYSIFRDRSKIKSWAYLFEVGGLIYVQFTKKHNTLECRVAVNTEKRVNSWKETYPKMQDPRLWQWKVVERDARRIFRSVTKITQAAPADATQARTAEH